MRQGCPSSPYIASLVGQPLNYLMLQNSFTGIYVFGKELKISQADYTTLFLKSTEEVSMALSVISKCFRFDTSFEKKKNEHSSYGNICGEI